MIGTSDWGNCSRSYDSADLALTRGSVRLDLFAGSAVLIDPSRVDRHKPGEHLYGAYGSIRGWIPDSTLEPYLLFKQVRQVTGEKGGLGDALLATPGVRLTGKAPWRVDYTVEVAVQRGSYSADRVSAMAGSYVVGWTANGSALKPRISVEYSHASGDSSSKDGSRGTFDQLWASNHQYYGIADQVGWRNLRNPRAGFDCLVAKNLKLRADFHEFYPATVQDGLYNAGGTRTVMNGRASSRHVGSEFDIQTQYQWSPTPAVRGRLLEAIDQSRRLLLSLYFFYEEDLAARGRSLERPLANARGSVDSIGYRAATVRERHLPRATRVCSMIPKNSARAIGTRGAGLYWR